MDRRIGAVVLLLLALLLGGCGSLASDSDGAGSSGVRSDRSEGSDRSSDRDEEDCTAERRVLQTALEAYYASSFRYTDETGLVDGGLLRSESDAYDIAPDHEVVAVEGGGCEGVGGEGDGSGGGRVDDPTFLPPGPDDDEACQTERRTLATALEAYYATSFTYTTEAGLVEAGLLLDESDRYDLRDGEVVAAPGGPCD